MRRLIVSTMAVAGLAACSGGGADGDVATSGDARRAVGTAASTYSTVYIGALTFDWPAGCAVPVVEEVTKDGETIVAAYDVVVERHGARVHVNVEELRGISTGGDAVVGGMAAVVEATMAVPEFVVASGGNLISVEGMDQVIEGYDSVGPGYSRSLTPEFRQLLADSKADVYWGTWVNVWVDIAEISQPTEPLDLPGGTARVESLPAPQGSAHLRLDRSITRSLDELTAIVDAENHAGAGSVTRTDRVEVVTDPATLRPEVATYEMTAASAEDPTTSTVESRTWTFEWGSLDCDAPEG